MSHFNQEKYNPHVSVDCVVFGYDYDEGKLKVLLIERSIVEKEGDYNDKKIPGSIIYKDEDLDEAAVRVLNELTGLKNLFLYQFKTFGDPKRTSNPRDIQWLEDTMSLRIGRVITVGYVSLIKINKKIIFESENTSAKWYDVYEVLKTPLAFDHNLILDTALRFMRQFVIFNPALFFELLPKKFTMTELRTLHDTLLDTKSDVRNFQKKMLMIRGLIPLGEVKKNVPYRAPKLYRFDNKLMK